MTQSAAQRTSVVVDPHPLWIASVAQVLQGIGIKVVGTTTETDEALELIVRERPNLLVTEIAAANGHMSGLDLIRAARKNVENIRVLVLSAAADPAQIDAAFERGVLAYVIKTAQPDDLASAVRQAFEHSVFFASTRGGGPVSVKSDDSDVLTRRELEILALTAEGLTNGQMARMLWVTEQTVKFHLSNVYRKLNVANRTEASRWAQRHGVLREQPATADAR